MPPPRKPNKADHYHTGEIVLRLARDRRRSVGLFFGSVLAVGAIIGFFYMQKQRPPTSPPSVIPGAPAGTPVATKIDPAPSVRSQTSVLTPMPVSPPPEPVAVQVSASKPGMLTLNDTPVGPVKKSLALTVKPGSYEVKLKVGRRVYTEKINVVANSPLSVHFDIRKKKTVVKPLPP